MKAQTGALQLLATLCDTIDKEDIVPLLHQFMPTVFSQFEMVINTMREKTEFDSTEVDYIISVTDCI